TETLSFKELGAAKWETHHPPQRMGNAADIAYGGFAVAVAAQAACKSVPESYHLYTLMGNFLGPAFTDRPLRASTRMLRKTRTFVTCQVEVSQLIAGKDGRPEDRICLIALADFQVQEKGNVLEYCAPPRQKYSHYDGLPGVRSNSEKLVEEGKVSKDEAQGFWTSFGLHDALFDSRPCPEGIFAQNLNGRSKKVETTQEGLHVTEKSTADWVRCRTPLPTQADHRTAMAFLMDSALSFTPLAFSQMYLDDTAACSSLDFALRLFSNSINLEAWHLRELVTHVGAEGRTYSEARIWDENRRCVGNMTQQGIMR
ncbi:Thioesterase/thiol ester dehydrase-isomerase, partial [Lentithecium fluviatile CBS 122367]